MNYWLWFVVLIPSVVLHEVAHGWVANFFGDPTAKEQHRLSLNPISHVDLFGTILMPAMLLFSGLPAFGYAKPVPVNLSRLRNPRKQALWVGLAGPAVNIVLSAVGFLICRSQLSQYVQLVTETGNLSADPLFQFGEYLGLANVVLAVFNLLPIPPLDGSAVIERFIPMKNLPRYYHLRARALPFFFIFLILDYSVFHVGTNWLNDVENWWLRLL